MPKNQNIILHSSGYAWAGDDDHFDITDFSFTLGLENVEAALKNSVYQIPTGQPIRARVQAAGLNANLLSRLTGGTVSAGCTALKVERLTKDGSDQLTLSETPADTDRIRVHPVGSSTSPLLQVETVSAVGEYEISGTTITLHASQTQDDFDVTYTYAEATDGDTLTIDPDDLPATFAFVGVVPAEDVFPGTAGYLICEFAKVKRTGDIELGGGKGAHRPLEWECSIVNTAPGDVKLHLMAE